MKQLFGYFASVLAFIGAILTFLQSLYLVFLRFGLFPFTSQSLEPENIFIQKLNVAFIQHMILLLVIFGAVETALLWLLVLLDIISRHHGLIATLVLVTLVSSVVLFAFTASIV